MVESLRDIRPDINWKDNLRKVLEWTDKEKIEQIENNDTYLLNIECHYIKPFYEKYGEDLPTLAKYAIWDILQKKHQGVMVEWKYNNIKVNLTGKPNIKLSDLGPKFENRPFIFEGTVLAVGRRQAYVKKCKLVCPKCFGEIHVEADNRRKIPQKYCSNRGCRKAPMEIDMETVKTEYVQDIEFQEMIDDVSNNEPIHFTAKLDGEDVGTSFIGQKKKVVGIFRTDLDSPKKQKEVYIDIMSIEDIDNIKLVKPTDEQVKKWMGDSNSAQFLSKILNSFAPHIYGYENIKLALLLTLVSKHGKINNRRRGWVNTFLVGDPGLAKTMLLEYCENITQKSSYTTGKGSTAAGLTAGMVKQDNGVSVLMAGVYPLSHMGYALIDEFDKMNKDDMGIMHEVMENGRVSRAVAGKKVNLPSIAPTIAAANPKFGSYDEALELMENIDIPTPIVNRFDLIFLIKDKVNQILDNKKADKVLEDFGEEIEKQELYMTDDDMMAYINYVREIDVKLTPEAKVKLKKIYEKLREVSKEKGNILVSPRQLESMARLAMNYAKLFFKNEATEEDVMAVYKLIKGSFETFGKKLEETGSQLTLITTEKLTKEQQFKTAWNKSKDDKDYVKEEDLYNVLEKEYSWERTSCLRKFQEYIQAGFIVKCRNMKYRWKE